MSELKNLVPPVELCKQIPEGEFADSCFARPDIPGEPVHTRNGKVYEHLKRCGITYYPAPTLEEILDALPKDDAYDDLHMNYVEGSVKLHGWHIYYIGDRKRHCYDKSAVTAALKLWLKLKGIEA